MKKKPSKKYSYPPMEKLERKPMWLWTPTDRFAYWLAPKRLRIQLLIGAISFVIAVVLVFSGVLE